MEETGEGVRSLTETEGTSTSEASPSGKEAVFRHSSDPHPPTEGEQYGKGVVFYLRDKQVVGLLLWNVFNRMPIARKVGGNGRRFFNAFYFC